MWKRGLRGNNATCSAPHFQSLPPLPTSNLGPPDADSQVGAFVYILGPCGFLQQTLLWGWEFLLCHPTPTGFYSQRFWGFISHAGTLVARSVSPSSHSSRFIHTQMWERPVRQLPSCHVSFLPQLLVSTPLTSLTVSSLTPWLSDFYTVWFSGSSRYFFCS